MSVDHVAVLTKDRPLSVVPIIVDYYMGSVNRPAKKQGSHGQGLFITETLGVFTCPSGSFGTHLSSMKKKGQEWIDRAKESNLTRRDIWFLLDCQLWPKLGYGVGCVSTPWKLLEGCLGKIW